MAGEDKPLVWLAGEIKTPPFRKEARIEAGFLLRRLQKGQTLGMPSARSMATVGRRCLELRVRDEDRNWRILLRVDTDAIVILDVFAKKTGKTPRDVLDKCRKRLKRYDEDAQKRGKQ